MQTVRGQARNELLDEVWSMYRTSYAAIGLHIPNAQGLLKYDLWEVAFDGSQPVAFNLYSTTRFGLKTGLLGSDGSSEGKSWVKQHIKARYRRPGVYGEVSHAVERLAAGTPVVCAVNVPKVLERPVIPESDGVHYKRQLAGMGWVVKKMVGNPKGGYSQPESYCPIPDEPGQKIYPRDVTATDHEADWMDAAEHCACQYEAESV